jgi:hypothetical protein
MKKRVLPSPEEIIAGRTGNGGWKRSVLEQWGVPWPPPKGWRRRLEDEWYRSQKTSREYSGTSGRKSLLSKANSEPTERPGPLDRDRRYLSPARAKKKFDEIKDLLGKETVWGRPIVREWA